MARRKARTFDVRIGPDVPDGRYEVRAVGPAGLSAPRTFSVSRLAEKQFQGNGDNSAERPYVINVGEIVNAKARSDQRDHFRFAARGDDLKRNFET